jgi:hypothetical protein
LGAFFNEIRGGEIMIPLGVESCVGESCFAEMRSDMIDEFSLRKGNLVAVVRPNKSSFEFSVRDLRREDTSFWGSGVDFFDAVNIVTELLDALTKGR